VKRAQDLLAAHPELPTDVKKPLVNNLADLMRAIAVRNPR
jgi:hypothetical protein